MDTLILKRPDGSTFEPVKADGQPFQRGHDKGGTPVFDPRMNQAAALYPKVVYRLGDGVEPFSDADEFNRALGHPVGHDPQTAKEAAKPVIRDQKVFSKLVHSEEEEDAALDEGYGPIGNCLAAANRKRIPTKLELLEMEREKDRERTAKLEAQLEELLAAQAATVKRGPGRPPKDPLAE
jgi:hypothetical protein